MKPSEIDFNTLTLSQLCAIYAETNGICTGYTEAGKQNLIRSLEYPRSIGKLKVPAKF